ncbi:inositol-tetrakisphosphate 1-kinase-like [Biomphalaria glabrata]|uniref:Inositol-tetrakisphosphate 1-kinase-like n=1 Tax=Biomphalaria glabrata TaxID=6526 RepID=A0A9W2ZVW0_BIOGL|nr:inositol-tetrakisphosphate 1-kinase-like [Biomphalaria glabrata]
MRRVGYWISEKKRKKLDFEEHRERFRNAGIELVQIDLKQPLEKQGPFDLLVHKVTDLLARAYDGHQSSERAVQNLETYIQQHPECIVLDPFDSIRRLLDRYTQYQRVSSADMMKDNRCMIPTFVELNSVDVEVNKEKLAKANVTFPLVCKPILAHGSTYAHQMSIIFNEDSLKDITPPCVAQSFINHNAILYKILVVGCKQFIIQRPSLKNLYPGPHPTIFFDTQEVSKADSDHPLNAVDYATLENQPTKPDWVYLDRLGQSMREAMELDLFGFDVIMDSETNQYGIIDINFFPGFEAIDNFFGILLEHIVKVLDAKDRGELVNGRLKPPPHDPACVNILNQLNLEARRASENQLNCMAKSPVTTSSPVIDLSPRSQEKNLLEEKPCSFYLSGNNNLIEASDAGPGDSQ